jgi:hypothetical protein
LPCRDFQNVVVIPIYSTDGIPTADARPIDQAWPVWVDHDEIGAGLDHLAQQAAHRGAHAIIALKISTYWLGGRNVQNLVPRARHVLFGTAVMLRPLPPENGDPQASAERTEAPVP